MMLAHEGESSMINVGCDIGKSNLDVYFNGKLRRYPNNNKGIIEMVKNCLAADSRVILEPSGGYERALLARLHEQEIPVVVVNPYYVRNFARSYRDLAKTDRIDAKMLSEYGEKMNPRNQEKKAEYCFELESLTERRSVLVESVKEEKLRLEKNTDKRTVQSIESHIKFLQLEKIESEIRKTMDGKANDIKEILQSEKGIGEQTAAILIASLPELGKFRKSPNYKVGGASANGKRKRKDENGKTYSWRSNAC